MQNSAAKLDAMAVETIIESVCHRYRITRAVFFSQRREKHLLRAQRECAVELRKLDMSLPEIGKAMNRDHTVILYYLRTR